MHPELPDLDGKGDSTLTNSRIKCFQLCQRKHYYQYVLSIKRREEEDSDALVFGSLWHEVLNKYHEARKVASDGNSNSESQPVGSAELAEGFI